MPDQNPVRITHSKFAVLKLLYKFRYLSITSLSCYTGKSKSAVVQTLATLINMKMITKKYDKSFRLQGKPAIYFLTPKGLKYLYDQKLISDKAVLLMRKNPYRSLEYMNKHLVISKLASAYKQTRPDYLQLTRYEILQYNSFPYLRPDLYLYKDKDGSSDSFIYYLNSEHFVELKKYVNHIVEHFDSDQWQCDIQSAYPSVLIFISHAKFNNKLNEYIKSVFESTGINGLKIHVSVM